MTDFWMILLAALIGYLSGSISFARLVSRLASPGREVGDIKVQVPDTDEFLDSDAMSATTVRLEFGPKFGCLVGIFDILKALLPALVFRLVYPDSYAYLAASGMAVVGHNWPVYYHYKGGRGLSSVLGGFLVMDWLGTLLTNLAGFLVGFPARNMLVITGLGTILMMPWIFLRTQNWVLLGYTFLMNVIFWGSMMPELKHYARLKREGKLEQLTQARQLRVIHEDGTERVDTFTLQSLVDRIKEKMSGKKGV